MIFERNFLFWSGYDKCYTITLVLIQMIQYMIHSASKSCLRLELTFPKLNVVKYWQLSWSMEQLSIFGWFLLKRLCLSARYKIFYLQKKNRHWRVSRCKIKLVLLKSFLNSFHFPMWGLLLNWFKSTSKINAWFSEFSLEELFPKKVAELPVKVVLRMLARV